jgi:hypothetical protein
MPLSRQGNSGTGAQAPRPPGWGGSGGSAPERLGGRVVWPVEVGGVNRGGWMADPEISRMRTPLRRVPEYHPTWYLFQKGDRPTRGRAVNRLR